MTLFFAICYTTTIFSGGGLFCWFIMMKIELN